jgi:ferredoxin
MAVMANPRLIGVLERYGAEDVTKCYHCGNCSATCPFSQEPFLFPRKSMRYLQMGLEERLKGNLEPWLCYYCGECTEQCPRGAEPGETMMSMRRWLIGQYDWTGLARLFSRSAFAEIAFVLVIALLTGAGFLAWGFTRGASLVDYQGFIPAADMHVFDLFLGLLFVGLVVTNALRMWWLTMRGERAPSAGPWLYLKHLLLLPTHFLTQRRYGECSEKTPWVLHMIMALSYLTMLALVALFLHRLQDETWQWPVHVAGYLASIGLLTGTAYALSGRLRRRRTALKHSHRTDWVFLLMLVYIVVTGIVQHVLHRLGLGGAANIAYLLHMMGVVPWMIRFPFSKWAHMAYRPLAFYFSHIQADAMRERSAAGAAVAAQPTV